MKKLLLTGMLAAFAVAAQAGDKACSDKEGCCAAKTKVSTEAKSDCCMAKQSTSTSTAKTKFTSKSNRNRQALLSPKAASAAS